MDKVQELLDYLQADLKEKMQEVIDGKLSIEEFIAEYSGRKQQYVDIERKAEMDSTVQFLVKIITDLLTEIKSLKEVRKDSDALIKRLSSENKQLKYKNEQLEKAKDELFAIKLYPAGITTNSDNGISSFDIEKLKPTLNTMSELNIPLLVHGETNDFVMDREANFAKIYEKLAKNFPKLKIVMEHITTKVLCDLLKDYENLYATITLHHLMITLDDVVGGKMDPHLFCKPIAKRYEDKDALCELAFSGYEKAMFGSDSANFLKNIQMKQIYKNLFQIMLAKSIILNLKKIKSSS